MIGIERLNSKIATKNISAIEAPTLEGVAISGRRWEVYSEELGIKAKALKGKKILNFGSGRSNIGKNLKKEGVECKVVDLDLCYRPQKVTERNFVQGNGRMLSFKNDAFNDVFALWTTYQIPLDAKEMVFGELMRVGEILHIAPVFGNDYEILSRMAEEKKFEIIACLPMDKLNFSFSSADDYVKYRERIDHRHRIEKPSRMEPVIRSIYDVKDNGEMKIAAQYIDREGGNTVVMKRRQV